MQPVFWAAASVSAVAAVVMVCMLKYQHFHGKRFYGLTFIAMIWTLITVGAEASTPSFACQFDMAVVAWLGNALVPVAWCFFVFAYVHQAEWLSKKRVVAALVLVPLQEHQNAASSHGSSIVLGECRKAALRWNTPTLPPAT